MLLGFQMRSAFRQRILNAALGVELAKTYGWPESDILLNHIVSEQPREWLPKEFTTYADLLHATYDEARQTLTKSMGADVCSWTTFQSSPSRR